MVFINKLMAWLWVVLSVLFLPTCSCPSMKNHGFTSVLRPLSLSCIILYHVSCIFDHVPLFLNYLNHQHSNISFTSQLQKDGKLHFFEIEISRSNGKFLTSVYCKLTFTCLFTHFHSFTPLA